MQSTLDRIWDLLVPALISMVCSVTSTAFFTGQYVQQILSNTDRIIVLERRGEELQTILYSVKEDSAINRNNFQWIKETLENERANQSNSRRSEGDNRRDPH
ncbi:hypothetical protein [Aeromonas enteropelogenes]|uniref:hypothetical protein n=1 Tax=Aeromonas enteropelogenes TaxID=29489 RepID=UPI001CBE2A56|nr:hypothetical protein [Aeromonas enteropelogenes]UAK70923.1 hypothetical protein K8O95_14745 [Aeromonas enteropelogenes]